MATEKTNNAEVKNPEKKPDKKPGKIKTWAKKVWKNKKKIGVMALGAVTSFISGFFTGRSTAQIPALPDLGEAGDVATTAAEVAETVTETIQ